MERFPNTQEHEPTENVWKGEEFTKKETWKVIECHVQSGPIGFLYSQLVTDRGFLLVGAAMQGGV